MTAQLIALFCFGCVVTFVVFLGIVRAREIALRQDRARASVRDDRDSTLPRSAA